jgi:peptidoglycan hydrolase-like protein with peptidoglycan-binding domain
MALESARFRGDPVLERIATNDTTAFLRFGAKGDHVQKVQFALIDLGFDIPDGATGNFLQQTSAAVVAYKTSRGLVPHDPVAGIGTVTTLDREWATPFADRDEFLSWQTRPIPEFNFTRADELARRQAGRGFALNPLSAFLPAEFRDGIFAALTGLLDPAGSPLGKFTPSATWGASPLDTFHCHVVVDTAGVTPAWQGIQGFSRAIDDRAMTMMRQADQAGPEGTPPWTAVYRALLLAPGDPSFAQRIANLLNDILRESRNTGTPVKLLWHTFEHDIWRPVEVGSHDPRRAWWNVVAPAAGPVTQWPFPVTDAAFVANVAQLLELGVIVDKAGTVTVAAPTRTEAAALAGLDKKRIDDAT